MSPSQKTYWFPAKKYGWGWGLPTCWQGWLVFGVYFALFGVGMILLQRDPDPAKFIAFATGLTTVMVFICWKKGEPPRWRWGGE